MMGAFFGEMSRALLLTAIPKITSEFQSLDQAAWYQASHDLARLAFLPIFGRVYTLFPLKITYCTGLLIYIVGAIVCATSSTSHVLIVGRAIQGLAHAGLHLGCFIIICHVVPTRNMPVFLASIILMNGIAAGVGPPLALSFIAGCLIIFTFPEPVRVTSNYSLRDRLKSTDQLSVVLILTSLTALFLALQWGGTKYQWSDPWIWGLLIGFAVMAGLFWFIQVKEKDRALIPIRILTQRTVGFGCLYCTFLITAYGIFIYYMPFYFQAARGYSPKMSGIYILALAIPDTVVALAIGAAATYSGHYVPFMVASAASVLVGSGLLSQIRVDTAMSYIIGLELIISLGLGLGIQLPLSAIRNVLDEPDVPAGEALVLFCLSLGATVAFPIAQAIFMNVLGGHLATGLSAERVAEVLRMGASKVSAEHLGEELVPFVAESTKQRHRRNRACGITRDASNGGIEQGGSLSRAKMAARDVLKFLKFSFPFLVSYGLKRLAQRIGALIHAIQYDPGPSPKNVVVIGGSFAGIALARRLCDSLPSGYKVVLVERNTHFHYPFVFPRYSVVRGHEPKAFIPYDEILYSGRKGVPVGIFERRRGTVSEVTRDSVRLASGEVINFEFLAIATGTSSPQPSKLLSNDKHGACEELRRLQERISSAENIAVVGGGAVGVELATDIKGWYPEKDVTLVHSRNRLLHGYGSRLHDRVMAEMEKLGIAVMLGQRPQVQLQDNEKTGVNAILVFPDGRVDRYELVISCTGQTPNTQFLTQELSKCVSDETGRILVAPSLQIRSPEGTIDNILALGDVAETGGPKMARAAECQSHVVASNIVSLIKRRPALSTYRPVKEVEGAIKLTLGKVCRPRAAPELVPANDGRCSLRSRCTQKITAEIML
ncbi:hypothetical protein KVR01_009238 [Diaporthe batatas]|uniref:uncharacterized protein n=1 Tax=Diaporthe batatas TaxID=748121 RepID=UPI001D03848E|nr:uncharacterized protein KVR01_009238 [Diaporthe batatas]KAG8160974.1 hypothetical protein KVR01_009238 [Diaporthe batatas]